MDWDTLTIGESLRRTASQFPQRIALVGGDKRISFAELDRAADELAHGLRALGVGRGDQVALWITNSPEWVVCWMACARLGAVLVTVNTRYKPDEVEYILRQSDARVLIAMDRFWDIDFAGMIRDLVPELADCTPGSLNWMSPARPICRRCVPRAHALSRPARHCRRLMQPIR